MAVETVTIIAGAIKAAAEVWYEYLKSADKRKAQAAIEAAEKYIQVNERSGEFASTTPSQQVKLLKHYSKRFFTYNN